MYCAIESGGLLATIAVYHEEKLVGLSVTLLCRHQQYDRGIAEVDLLYVTPEHRGLGSALIAATEELAKKRGAEIVRYPVLPGGNADALLRRHRYTPYTFVYAKERTSVPLGRARTPPA